MNKKTRNLEIYWDRLVARFGAWTRVSGGDRSFLWTLENNWIPCLGMLKTKLNFSLKEEEKCPHHWERRNYCWHDEGRIWLPAPPSKVCLPCTCALFSQKGWRAPSWTLFLTGSWGSSTGLSSFGVGFFHEYLSLFGKLVHQTKPKSNKLYLSIKSALWSPCLGAPPFFQPKVCTFGSSSSF